MGSLPQLSGSGRREMRKKLEGRCQRYITPQYITRVISDTSVTIQAKEGEGTRRDWGGGGG